MTLAVYLVLALVAGLTWGWSLGFLLNAPRTKASETKQWLSLAASALVVMACAVVMKYTGEAGQLSGLGKASATLAFLLAFSAAFARCKVRL